jgi:hypothetical protein
MKQPTRILDIPLPDGTTVPMPEPQVREVVRLHKLHPDCSWHFNECGCCVCLHPDADDSSRGWIIPPSGESEYHEERH